MKRTKVKVFTALCIVMLTAGIVVPSVATTGSTVAYMIDPPTV